MDVKTMVSREALLASAALIKAKLDRIVSYVSSTYIVNGVLDKDYQWANRICEARKRDLDRIILIRTRPEGDEDRRLAEMELNLRHRDDGELFRWRLKNHSYGRLACKGCEFDYVRDKVTGLNLKQVLSRLCPYCKEGLQHSTVVESREDLQESLLGFLEAIGCMSIEGIEYRPNTADAGLLYCCDVCGSWDLESLCCE